MYAAVRTDFLYIYISCWPLHNLPLWTSYPWQHSIASLSQYKRRQITILTKVKTYLSACSPEHNRRNGYQNDQFCANAKPYLFIEGCYSMQCIVGNVFSAELYTSQGYTIWHSKQPASPQLYGSWWLYFKYR